ncbi:MAG: SPOR domain-containing protein [Sulfurimonas sp.]|nr:SPOR domain-containing protein [Sulfurimonas sp.]
MKESNELNDIILNKSGSTSNNKKIILAVATLGVILIIVVVLMNTLTSDGTDNLPQAILPPEPKAQAVQKIQEEALFEEVEIIQEISDTNDNLDKIAKRLKEESQIKEPKVIAPPVVKKVVPVTKTTKVTAPKAQTTVKSTPSSTYYIQVGSFSKYEPNKKFLKSIIDLGYNYKYHKVTKDSKTLNKVLVGPFSTITQAKDARRILRAKVEPGAFLTKIK